MDFRIPTKNNTVLERLLGRIYADTELHQLWRCANMNAIDRSAISDHGEVHVRIVANAALRILRLLVKGGVEPSVVRHHGLAVEDAEVIVVLAACFHDTGIAVHRDSHEQYSLIFAYPKARALLQDLYDEAGRTIITSEVMHAVIAHKVSETCLTIESGVLKVADALDMAEGRTRIPFEAGKVDIHSISALAVDAVEIEPGTERPVRIVVRLANSAGIFQVDELLRKKIKNSSIRDYVEVIASIEGDKERRLMESYRF